MNNKSLRDFYKFDDADLIANRYGSITQNQLNRIGHQRRAINNGARIIGLLLIMGTFLGIYLLWQYGLIENDILSILSDDWGLIIPLLMGALAIWASFTKEDSVTLSKVEGPAEVVKVKSRYHGSVYYHYELRCGQETFEASVQLMDAISKEDACIIYYFKDLANGEVNRVLSIEKVGSMLSG